ncbi:MAG TPA: TonB-dependent receptor [Caulobacteraceae bacterium]|nr:TonB-dependent receptor [Caulobacteraceae bacterium]
MFRTNALMAGASLAILGFAHAHAADATAAGGPAGPGAIEEVVVTAQKVTTNLQKTPLAVTALSSSALEASHIVAPKDLDNIVPGLVVNTTPSNPLAISIRGAGYEGIENTSAQPGVSYNQNGVYIASPISLNANFLDVDTVEVLRGPQGTVLGQNSDGGAINVTTIKPKLGVYTGYGDVSGGSYAYDRVRAALNVPLGNSVAVRVALQQEAHGGWATATQVPGTGGKYPMSNENSYNGRVDILWKPTDAFTGEIWYEHYSNDTNGDGYKNLKDPNPNPRELTQDYPSKMHQRADNVALNLTYDLGWSTAKFIGSYQAGSLDGSEDLDKLSYATAVPLLGIHDIDVENNRDGHSYTAEWDLISKSGTNFDWIVGAFYLNQRYNEGVLEYQYSTNPSSPFYDPYGLPVNLGVTNPYYLQTENFTGPVAFETRDTQRLESGSVYGQATFHATDKLRFTIGARGTQDFQIGVIQDFFALADRNETVPQDILKTKFATMTGRLEAEYDLTPTNTVYAMASDGIKPGGANLNPTAVVIPLVFQPERVAALEVGSKNEFMDKTVRLNVSAFYNKIYNFQVDSEDPIPYQGGLTNVKASHVYGLEAEGTWLLPYGLRLDGNLTAQGSRVDDHQQLFDPAVAEQIDIANGGPFFNNDVANRFTAFYARSGDIYGKQLPKVPDFTGNISLQHTYAFDDGGKITSSVHFIYRNPYFFRIYNSPSTDLVPSQRQIDMNFSYMSPSKLWHLDFLIVNVTDSDSVNSRYTDNFGTFITANYYVPPRQFIGRVGVAF